MSRLPIAVMMFVALSDLGVSRTCSIRRRQEFSTVTAADRIEVQDSMARPLSTITDPARVKAAVAFILERPDNWTEPLGGGAAPRIQIAFFRGSEWLRGFGMSHDYLTDGSLSRPTPSEEIEALMRQLDLQWPNQ